MEIAGKEERIINSIIDTTFIIISTLIIFGLVAILSESVSMNDRPISTLIFLVVYLIYYIIFEFKTGKTPGKTITYTTVLKKDNQKIKFTDALLRTLIRLTGLDVYSYLFGTELGMHDTLTNTKVIKDQKDKNPAYNTGA